MKNQTINTKDYSGNKIKVKMTSGNNSSAAAIVTRDGSVIASIMAESKNFDYNTFNEDVEITLVRFYGSVEKKTIRVFYSHLDKVYYRGNVENEDSRMAVILNYCQEWL